MPVISNVQFRDVTFRPHVGSESSTFGFNSDYRRRYSDLNHGSVTCCLRIIKAPLARILDPSLLVVDPHRSLSFSQRNSYNWGQDGVWQKP